MTQESRSSDEDFSPADPKKKDAVQVSEHEEGRGRKSGERRGQDSKMKDLSLEISPRMRTSALGKAKKDGRPAKLSAKSSNSPTNMKSYRQAATSPLSPAFYLSAKKPPQAANAKAQRELKPNKHNLNQYFKEAHIGLTGEQVINYFHKTASQNVFIEQLNNPVFVNAVAGLTE